MKRRIAGRLSYFALTVAVLMVAMTAGLFAAEAGETSCRDGHDFKPIVAEEGACGYSVEDGYYVCTRCGIHSLDGEYICLDFYDKNAEHWDDAESHVYGGTDACLVCGAPYCEHTDYNIDPTSNDEFLACTECGESELMRIFVIRPDSERIYADTLRKNGWVLNDNMVVEYTDEDGEGARYFVPLDTSGSPDEPIEIRLPEDTREVNVWFFYENKDGDNTYDDEGLPVDGDGNPYAMVYSVTDERLVSCWVYPYDPIEPQYDSIGYMHDFYMLGECTWCSETLGCAHESITHLEPYTVSCCRRQVEMYICNDCGAGFADKSLTERFSLDELPMEFGALHALEHVEGEEASCGEKTPREAWHCTLCGAYFADESGQKALGFEPPLNELLEHSFGEGGKCTRCDAVTTRHTGYGALIDEGVIGMRYYFTLDSSDAPNYEELVMEFRDENGEPLHMSALGFDPDADEDKRYFADYPVAVKNLTDTVSGHMEVSGGVIDTELYSLKEYLDTVAEGAVEEYKEYIPLVKSLLVLGGCAQTYFGYDGDSLASDELPTSTDIPAEYNKFSIEGTLDEGISFVGGSLSLESYTALNFYYYSELDLSDYGLIPTSQENVWLMGGYLPPFMYDNTEHCRAEVAGASIVYTPMTYAYRTFNNQSSSPELKNVCLALYDFYLAAAELVKEKPDAISATYIMYSVE